MPNYRALVGMNYPPDRRVEAGDVVSDIPAKSIKWLREQGLIELVGSETQDAEDETDEVAAEVDDEGAAA